MFLPFVEPIYCPKNLVFAISDLSTELYRSSRMVDGPSIPVWGSRGMKHVGLPNHTLCVPALHLTPSVVRETSNTVTFLIPSVQLRVWYAKLLTSSYSFAERCAPHFPPSLLYLLPCLSLPIAVPHPLHFHLPCCTSSHASPSPFLYLLPILPRTSVCSPYRLLLFQLHPCSCHIAQDTCFASLPASAHAAVY